MQHTVQNNINKNSIRPNKVNLKILITAFPSEKKEHHIFFLIFEQYKFQKFFHVSIHRDTSLTQ